MTIFTKEQMWDVATATMGTQQLCIGDDGVIVLDDPEDVAELYKALQLAHASCIDNYEKRIW